MIFNILLYSNKLSLVYFLKKFKKKEFSIRVFFFFFLLELILAFEGNDAFIMFIVRDKQSFFLYQTLEKVLVSFSFIIIIIIIPFFLIFMPEQLFACSTNRFENGMEHRVFILPK